MSNETQGECNARKIKNDKAYEYVTFREPKCVYMSSVDSPNTGSDDLFENAARSLYKLVCWSDDPTELKDAEAKYGRIVSADKINDQAVAITRYIKSLGGGDIIAKMNELINSGDLERVWIKQE